MISVRVSASWKRRSEEKSSSADGFDRSAWRASCWRWAEATSITRCCTSASHGGGETKPKAVTWAFSAMSRQRTLATLFSVVTRPRLALTALAKSTQGSRLPTTSFR